MVLFVIEMKLPRRLCICMLVSSMCVSPGFRWPVENDEDNSVYNKILHKFLDVRGGVYSIQMIALQGQDFGRPVGQWFGPNNVAQAIK